MTQEEKYYEGLVRELIKSHPECEWLEFKHNKIQKEELGEYISALANAALLCEKTNAYMIWGVRDKDRDIVGTDFQPKKEKVGNQELESWLLQLLSPKIHFSFYRLTLDTTPVFLLEITPASHSPVAFKNEKYIRIGSYKKKLKDYPEKERLLWRLVDKISFEEEIAKNNISANEVISLLDYPKYFELMNIPLPPGRDGIIDALAKDDLIVRNRDRSWNITNLGAILFAKDLSDFSKLNRKSIRVIFYQGNNKLETRHEQEGVKGYASGFEGLIGYINSNIPKNEVIEQALRKTVPMFPELAIRELVANALIHQDFHHSGTNPMIEVFSDRIEITNPGNPLIDTRRFLDSPPKSRNEKIAAFMRRIGICEERGSGIDKVAMQTELFQLPAPLFETPGDYTRAVLFAHKPFDDMSKEDRVRSCYVHCVLRYICREVMDNASLRERFKLPADKASIVTRIIKSTIDAGLIVDISDSGSRKYKNYVPYWCVHEVL